MKIRYARTSAVLACLVMASTSLAQPPEGRPGRGRGGPGGPGGGGFGQMGRGGGMEMMMRMHPVFAVLDADQDGAISTAEMQNAAVALRKLDTNNDGKIAASELQLNRGGMGRPGGGRPGSGQGMRPGPQGDPEMAKQRFDRMDANGDGKITEDEAPEPLKRLFARLDADGDQAITMEEMSKMRQRGGAGGRQGRGQRGGGGDAPGGDKPKRPEIE